MQALKLPTPAQVADCIGKLTRRATTASLIAKPSDAKLLYGGFFHDGDRNVIAMCAADLPLAARSGAALSMVPADVADEQIDEGELGETLSENFAEILNVLAGVYVGSSTVRVTLLRTVFAPEAMPMTIEGAAPAAVRRADFMVEIDGYGTGHLALWGLA